MVWFFAGAEWMKNLFLTQRDWKASFVERLYGAILVRQNDA
jgi:hypothetical protein